MPKIVEGVENDHESKVGGSRKGKVKKVERSERGRTAGRFEKQIETNANKKAVHAHDEKEHNVEGNDGILADAIVHPAAMMVHLGDTDATRATMF